VAWEEALTSAREWSSVTFESVSLTDAQIKALLPLHRGDPRRIASSSTSRARTCTSSTGSGSANTEITLQLTGCVFEDEINLTPVFSNTRFDDVRFRRAAFFSDADFTGETAFRKVRFEGGASFNRARFNGPVTFEGVTGQLGMAFQDAVFAGRAEFGPLRGDRWEAAPVTDVDSSYAGSIRRVGDDFLTTFERLDCSGAEFRGDLELDCAVSELASFVDTRFTRAFCALGGPKVAFDAGHFAGESSLVLVGGEISMPGCRFEKTCRLRFSGDLVADACFFLAESTIAGPPRHAPETGRIRSLRGASVEHVAIQDADLSSCLFDGAYNLDELRIAPSCRFAAPPDAVGFAHRQTIAEENLWRAHGPPRHRLGGASWEVPAFPESLGGRVPSPQTLEPADVALLYRALRKSTEDRKDQPGAADFYYGEMEMRRHGARRTSGEALLLSLFWASSGYALRASRAIVGVALICVVFALGFTAFGFAVQRNLGDALIYSFGASARVATKFDHVPLTAGGSILAIVLGIVGPLLFGLALLSVRGRVQR
jgi:uncharacterized protein YjbI with pentapeptide repeats